MEDLKELTLEQQFNVQTFKAQVEKMSHDQAKNFLVEFYVQHLKDKNGYQQLIKHNWGLD